MSHYILNFSNLIMGLLNYFISKLYVHGILLVIFILSYYIFKRFLVGNTLFQKLKDEKEVKKYKNPYRLSIFEDKPIVLRDTDKTSKIMVSVGITKNIDIDTYILMEDFEAGIKHYVDKMNEGKCIEILDKMSSKSIIPNYEIYSALMTLFLKNKKINQALGMFNDMKINNINLNENIYYIIIKGCVDCNKIDQASEVMLDCFKNNILLNPDICNQVSLRLVNTTLNEKYYFVSEFLNEFRRMNITIKDTTFFAMMKYIKKINKKLN
jgi:pentatricopeptide repeat protein